MKEENKKYIRQLAMASTIGFELAFSVFIGLALGVWLDSRFDTFPWLSLLFMVLGVAAGFVNFYRFTVKQKQEDEDSKK